MNDAGALRRPFCIWEAGLTIVVRDLQDVPAYRSIVADRIWRAWWEPYGAVRSELEKGLDQVAAAADFPSFTLVALDKHNFLGTLTAIRDDIEARPNLEPCIAALWIEEPTRGQGIGQTLIEAACARLSATGFSQAFLAAKPPLHSYYSLLGWQLVEKDVGDDRLGVFCRALP